MRGAAKPLFPPACPRSLRPYSSIPAAAETTSSSPSRLVTRRGGVPSWHPPSTRCQQPMPEVAGPLSGEGSVVQTTLAPNSVIRQPHRRQRDTRRDAGLCELRDHGCSRSPCRARMNRISELNRRFELGCSIRARQVRAIGRTRCPDASAGPILAVGSSRPRCRRTSTWRGAARGQHMREGISANLRQDVGRSADPGAVASNRIAVRRILPSAHPEFGGRFDQTAPGRGHPRMSAFGAPRADHRRHRRRRLGAPPAIARAGRRASSAMAAFNFGARAAPSHVSPCLSAPRPHTADRGRIPI